MVFGLGEETLNQIKHVFSLYPDIEKVIIYGSRAKGNFKKGSDIDLTIVGDALNQKDLNEIGLVLDDLLLPWQIDLSLYHHIDNADLKDHIERVGQLFFKK